MSPGSNTSPTTDAASTSERLAAVNNLSLDALRTEWRQLYRCRVLPSLLQMRDESRNDQKVERPRTQHLIGNAYIAALRKFRFGLHWPDRFSVPGLFGTTTVVRGKC